MYQMGIFKIGMFLEVSLGFTLLSTIICALRIKHVSVHGSRHGLRHSPTTVSKQGLSYILTLKDVQQDNNESYSDKNHKNDNYDLNVS